MITSIPHFTQCTIKQMPLSMTLLKPILPTALLDRGMICHSQEYLPTDLQPSGNALYCLLSCVA